MKQLNLPRKLVSTIQLWASVALLVIAFIFSLMPTITIKMDDNISGITEMASKVLPDEDFGFLEDMDEVEFSAPKLIGTISLFAKIISVSAADPSDPDADDKREELQEYLESDEGKEDIATAVSIAFTIVNTFELDEQSNIFSIILTFLISLVGLLAVLILTILLPILIGISCIGAVISALKNIKTPENVSAAVASKLPGKLSLVLAFMLFQCVVSGMTYAAGVSGLLIICVISVVLNFVVSRLREYPSKQFRYLNVLQLPAIVGIIGFVIFFFNIIDSGVFSTFAHGDFALYLTEALALTAAKQTVNNAYIVDAILIIVYLGIVLGCSSYLNSCARRVSCAVRREKPKGLIGIFFSGKLHDNNLVKAIFTLGAFIIPTVIAGMKHFYNDPTSTAAEGDASFLTLSAEQESALSAALVGIIIMIVAELAVVILKKVFCKDVSVSEAEELMTGKAMTSAEKLAEAQSIVAEAAAAEAATADKADE